MSPQITRLFTCLAITFWTFATAQADEWPSQQVNIVVPFSAGGSTDILARVVAQHLQAKFGQPFVVQNKSGAGGGIGVAATTTPEEFGAFLKEERERWGDLIKGLGLLGSN